MKIIFLIFFVLGVSNSLDIILNFKEKTSKALENVRSQSYSDKDTIQRIAKNSLIELRDRSQKSVLSFLNEQKIKYQSLYISNIIGIKGANQELINKIASFPEVEEVIEDIRIPLADIQQEGQILENEWNIDLIEAPAAWNYSTGANVKIGIIDTGVMRDHIEFGSRYVGNQNYGWYDPISGNPNPMDPNGHGTHCLGTVLGSSGIGVAPDATWMACRGCESSSCSISALITCGQFMFCPHDQEQEYYNCTRSPYLVSNSWGGDADSAYFDSVIDAWRTVGIIPIFANGNFGPSCSTALYPGVHTRVISVGATDNRDAHASFSSKGPFGRVIKPDFSAPGDSIRSSYVHLPNSYEILSGTSMATPHLAGVIALMFSIEPTLTYNEVYEILKKSVDTNLIGSGGCGDIDESNYPNNTFGYGRINALKAVLNTIEQKNKKNIFT